MRKLADDSSELWCAGWQRLIRPTRCESAPVYRVHRLGVDRWVCGMHASAALRELLTGEADDCVTVTRA